LLRKITELVDRDVAANSKPISMVGAAIPFVPFMLFVDGAPADRHPVLGGLAFGASLCWLAFVFWRMLRHTRTQLEGYGYVVGSARFWRLMIGTVLLVAAATAAVMWVQNQIG
jgi:hypothetical protein